MPTLILENLAHAHREIDASDLINLQDQAIDLSGFEPFS